MQKGPAWQAGPLSFFRLLQMKESGIGSLSGQSL